MNLIDIFLILVFLLAVWSGWRRGFILGSLGLLTCTGSLLAGFFLYPFGAEFLKKIFPSLGVWLLPAAFIGIVLMTGILLTFLTRRILRTTPEEAHRHEANKLLGIIPGALNGMIWGVIISAMLFTIPVAYGISTKTRESRIAGKLAVEASWLERKIAPVFDQALSKTFGRLTVLPGSDNSVELNFTVADPKVRNDIEAEMLMMVNEERSKHGLRPLKADPEMAIVARKHSRDMFNRGYFAHYTPEGISPFDRMTRDKVQFLNAGENLALAQTLTQAHMGLMNSPGHRANILNASYGRLGIGVLDGGYHGLMITQNFRN